MIIGNGYFGFSNGKILLATVYKKVLTALYCSPIVLGYRLGDLIL